MIQPQHPPLKITISKSGKEDLIAILPKKVDLELIFLSFEGLLIDLGYTKEEIHKIKNK